MDFDKADMLFNRGGSYLRMSRFKPTDKDFEERFNLDFFKENNVKLLVTVGRRYRLYGQPYLKIPGTERIQYCQHSFPKP